MSLNDKLKVTSQFYLLSNQTSLQIKFLQQMKKVTLLSGLLFFLNISAQDISLPQPVKTGGMPIMDALNNRSSHREFSEENIDNQTLSNMLWAAWGYNRADKRTAPSANDKQEMELYVIKKEGVYRYDARANKLTLIHKNDVRKDMGKQEFVWNTPVNIALVADKTKKGAASTDAGFISQNIYLFCASEGLGTVVRGYFDKNDASKALRLTENQEIILIQTVGKKK